MFLYGKVFSVPDKTEASVGSLPDTLGICIIISLHHPISSEGDVGRFMLSENSSEVFSDLCSLIIRPVVIQRTPALLSNKFHLHLKYSSPFPQMRYYPSGMAAIQELSESESRSVMSDSL